MKIIDTQKIFEIFLQNSIILVLCIWYYAVFPSLQNEKRLLLNHSYPRLSSLLLSSIADVATGTPFYLAKVGQPGGTPRTIARFHDSFRGSHPQIAYNLGIPRKQRWNFLAYPPVGRSMIHASKKAL